MEGLPSDILLDNILPFVGNKDIHALRQTCTKAKSALEEVACMRKRQYDIRNSIGGDNMCDVWIISRDVLDLRGYSHVGVAIDVSVETSCLEEACIPELGLDGRSASDLSILQQVISEKSIEMTCFIPLSEEELFRNKRMSVVIQPMCFFHREINTSEAREVYDELSLQVRYMYFKHAMDILHCCIANTEAKMHRIVMSKCLDTLSSCTKVLHDAVYADVGMAFINASRPFAKEALKEPGTISLVQYVSNKAYAKDAHFLLQNCNMGGIAVVIKVKHFLLNIKLYITLSGKVCLTDAKSSFAGEKEVYDMSASLFSKMTRWAFLLVKNRTADESCAWNECATKSWFNGNSYQGTDITRILYAMAVNELQVIVDTFSIE